MADYRIHERGPMVRAILEGRKTQFRRIVRLPPASQGWRFIECAFNCEDSARYHAGFAGNAEFKGSIICVDCPYGKPPDPIFKNPGDRLWVWDGHAFITPEITSIRVERLQQISEADAMAEGCPLINPDPFIPGHGGSSASGWYSQLWEDIHGAGSWDADPWVWVVEFRALERGDG
jgi:hypothetical protein